jgi:hypothetical protein
MEDEVVTMLSLLRGSESTRWVAEQVVRTFSQGLSMSVKDASQDLGFSAREPAGLTTRERRKREKYETTRPYSDQEKVDLLRRALEALYVELPAIQVAALNGLKDLRTKATTIEFVAPDEPEQSDVSYSVSLETLSSQKEYLITNFREFAKILSS